MTCIYHSRDLDGFVSGAIVKRAYPDAKLIGFDYGQKLDMSEIPPGEDIIMVDVSLPMVEMLRLATHSGFHLTWIDHHISAINDFEEFTKKREPFLTAILNNGIAACEITWNYLFPLYNIPAAVTLLGKYDTWRNNDQGEWNETILPFQYGMRLVCNSPETLPRKFFSSLSLISNTINDGKKILGYQNTQNELSCKRGAFECMFSSYRVICLNIIGGGSQLFKSIYDESKHDIMVTFFFDGKKWMFSLYTTKDDIDCSLIAKSMGGGGHKKAAGFEDDEFILFSNKKQ